MSEGDEGASIGRAIEDVGVPSAAPPQPKDEGGGAALLRVESRESRGLLAEVAAEDQQVLGLGGGALSDVQEARILLLPLPA